MPKVSILIPTYKQPELLERLLRNIFSQTFTDYEIIVTDDSPDDSVEKIADRYKDKIRYYHNVKSLGSPKNWNFAIDCAQGEYLKFVHHDDYFSKDDSLEKYVKLLDENPEADFGFSGTEVRRSNGDLIRINAPNSDRMVFLRKNLYNIFPNNYIGAPSATIYRKRVNKYFDEKLKWVVDIDFYIQILQANQKIAYIEEALICTTSGASHQITSECVDDMKLVFFEWSYLYGKIIKHQNLPVHLFSAYKKKIKELVRKYDVLTFTQLGKLLNYPLDFHFKLLIIQNKFRFYRKKLKCLCVKKMDK